MPLVFGAIAPHGGEIVPELAADPATMARTRAGILELGRRCAAARPDTIVVLDPHGSVVRGHLAIGATKHAAGILEESDGRGIQAAFETDLGFVHAVLENGAGSLPLVRLRGEETGEDAVLPLSWGALIPLWFLAEPLAPKPRVVVIAPDRGLPREMLVRLGVLLARVAQARPERVALVASCDQGHAHDPDGPYGYSPASAEHDVAMCAAIAEDDLPRLIDWPEAFLEEAKVDAYWQTIILAGALGLVPMRAALLSYEAPTYFGMIVAAYTP
jgi:aromatic ring-opening dioxygenase LigB subunit